MNTLIEQVRKIEGIDESNKLEKGAFNRQAAITRINNAIDKENDGWTAQWWDNSQLVSNRKYSIAYDHELSRFDAVYTVRTEVLETFNLCRNEEIALEIIENHKSDLELIFGVIDEWRIEE